MSTFKEIKKCIQDRINFNITLVDKSNISIANVNFKPPPAEPWIRISVDFIFDARIEIGSPGKNARQGLGNLNVGVFTPKHEGSDDSDDICDEILQLFKGQVINDLIFETGIIALSTIDEREYYQQQFSIPFKYYNVDM